MATTPPGTGPLRATGTSGPTAKPRVAPPPPLTPSYKVGPQNSDLASGSYYNSTADPNAIYRSTGDPVGAGDPGSSSADGSGDSSSADPNQNIDWTNVYFGSYNLPPDLQAQIQALGVQYGASNPDVFYQSAQNAIRGSDWFKTTYPGFFAGVRAGLYTDETGYRGYVDQLNNTYRQYTGNAVSSADVEAALSEGITPDIVGRRFSGQAYVDTNRNDIQYAAENFGDAGQGKLSDAELKAYGQEQSGIDTPLGQQIKRRLDLASQRLNSIFKGSLATPGLSLGPNGVSSQSLLGTKAAPDVAS